jgi:hypothetical protein
MCVPIICVPTHSTDSTGSEDLSSSRKHKLEPIQYLNAWLHMNARMPQVREVETMLQDIKVSDELVAQ